MKLSSLKVKEMESSDTYALDFPSDNAVKDEETIEQVLFLLDKFCASDELYHEFTLAYDDLPRSYLVKQKRSELNKLCHIEKVPGQFPGAQISFSETRKDHIREFLKSHPDHDVTDDPIKVKISADGVKMSKTTNFMILSFALLQTGKNVMSSSGNRSLAIVNGPEKCNTLASSFATVINDINSVAKNGKINVDGKDIPDEMFLGGDYKFLLMAMGLRGATSDYSCLWCKIYRLQRWDMTKDLDYYNTGELSRSIQEPNEYHAKNKFCCFQPPLFSIDLDHVILDELHLMLRISDRLTENLIKEVMERDSEADFLKKRGEPKGVYLNKLVTVINSLGISFSVWEQSSADRKESDTYDWTSLAGSEKKKLINLLPDQLEINDILFPETKDTVIKLWLDFGFLYQLINQTSDDNPNLYVDVFSKAREFINLFCSLGSSRIGYNNSRVTPYMHALAYHAPIFLKNHLSFKQFTGQGVEKNNDDAKKIFYQKSNKWDAAHDVLLHESRQLALKHNEHNKRRYEKKDENYWGSGIVDTRKKRAKASRNHVLHEIQQLPSSLQNETGLNYKDMTVHQLKDEIKSKGLKVKGVAKMKKCQLIKVLQVSGNE